MGFQIHRLQGRTVWENKIRRRDSVYPKGESKGLFPKLFRRKILQGCQRDGQATRSRRIQIQNDHIEEQLAQAKAANVAPKQPGASQQSKGYQTKGYQINDYDCGSYQIGDYEISEYKSVYD